MPDSARYPILVPMLRGSLADYLACAYHTFHLWVMNVIVDLRNGNLVFREALARAVCVLYRRESDPET